MDNIEIKRTLNNKFSVKRDGFEFGYRKSAQ